MRTLPFIIFMLLVGIGLEAQTARLQVIHNSPSPTVDIWVNGSPWETDFSFREALEFRDVPAGVLLEIGIAPSPSSSPNDIIATFPVTLMDGETYVAIANGIVGDANKPFNLELYSGARETSTAPDQVDLMVFHGAPDAPNVDVDARSVATIVEDLTFGSFTDYISVPAAAYTLDIRPAGNPTVVATYAADVTGLAGQAAVVFASGFLGMDPAFGLYAALPNGDVVALPAITDARLQIIHNSPEPTVDIWVNDQPFLTDVDFRTATPFVNVPANTDLSIGIAPSPSTSPADIIYTLPANFLAGETYIAMANGVVGDMMTPFNIAVNAVGQETSGDPDQVDLMVFHGAPDAPNVDVDARNVATIVEDLTFGSFTDYISVPAAAYTLDIRPAGNQSVVATYAADVTGLAGQAAVVFASGFLGMDPAFGLYAALPNGDVVALPAITDARLQIIHNSPEPTVDIWVNDQPFLTDVDFRTATPFVNVPANTDLSIGIAPSPSTSPADIIYTLPANFLAGETYIAMANGVVGDMMTPFNIAVFDRARESASAPTDVDLLVFHGSPDAPTVDVTVGSSQIPLVDNLEYGTFQGYLSVPAAEYTLNITPDNDNANNLFSYDADITSLAGGSATVFASGFLASEPGFGLWVALADGTTFPLSISTSTNNPVLGELAIWPNPVRDQINIVSNAPADTRVILTLMDMQGRPIESQTQILGPSSGQVQLSASQLTSGIYFLQLQPDSGAPSTLTIMKQ